MAATHRTETLVILAERDSAAAHLYRRVGFTLAATALTLIGPIPPR